MDQFRFQLEHIPTKQDTCTQIPELNPANVQYPKTYCCTLVLDLGDHGVSKISEPWELADTSGQLMEQVSFISLLTRFSGQIAPSLTQKHTSRLTYRIHTIHRISTLL